MACSAEDEALENYFNELQKILETINSNIVKLQSRILNIEQTNRLIINRLHILEDGFEE